MKKLGKFSFSIPNQLSSVAEAGPSSAQLLHGGGPLVRLGVQRRRGRAQCGARASKLSGDPFTLFIPCQRCQLLQELTEGCVNGCHGHGACVLGKCQCHPGFDGDHCSQSKFHFSSSSVSFAFFL